MIRLLLAALTVALFFTTASAAEIKTNAVYMKDAPSWLTPGRIDKVVAHMQQWMEWDIRRVEVFWYPDQASFSKVHDMGDTVLAFSRQNNNTIHLGPKITTTNFDQVFGHELVHVISFQKYKGAIPKWLEEGLANYLSKAGHVDYKWLASQPPPADVRDLTHPFNGSETHIRYHYMASQALTEMIASKCDLSNLLRMSVGRKLENYLDTLCGIPDINVAFRKWIDTHKATTN